MSTNPNPIRHDAIHRLVRHLTRLPQPQFDRLLDQIRSNQPLSSALETARQVHRTRQIANHAANSLHLALDDSRGLVLSADLAFHSIVELLHQSPLGGQIPGEYYRHADISPPRAVAPIDDDALTADDSPPTRLSPPPWRRRSPSEGQTTLPAPDVALPRPESRQSRTTTRPSLADRLSSPEPSSSEASHIPPPPIPDDDDEEEDEDNSDYDLPRDLYQIRCDRYGIDSDGEANDFGDY